MHNRKDVLVYLFGFASLRVFLLISHCSPDLQKGIFSVQ